MYPKLDDALNDKKISISLIFKGLDPARPLFEIPDMMDDFKLDYTDAKFVDIIHTCGGVYGYEESHGHADFYPNNGTSPQPGCSEKMNAGMKIRYLLTKYSMS